MYYYIEIFIFRNIIIICNVKIRDDLFYYVLIWRWDLILDLEESVILIIVIRGFIENVMDDIERVIDDGVNTFKVFIKVLMIILIKIY